MNIGQAVSDAIIALAQEHSEVELEAKTYANLRYGGRKALGEGFQVRRPMDEGYLDGHMATIGKCRILVRRDVPDCHARVAGELIRLPYPEGFSFGVA